ncbi:MAG: thermonuclease family protein [Saccharofermentans sp.]|nr:thermonuclease family protein [Saccharofermentans sp.]
MRKLLDMAKCITIWVLLLVTACTGCKAFPRNDRMADESIPEVNEVTFEDYAGPYKVDYVIDGDTIIVLMEEKRVHVRLIGIDTPESASHDESENTEYGIMASEYTRTLLEDAEVYLEYDEEKEDQYGRELAYVYILDENQELKMVNLMLVSDGYAWPYPYAPNLKYKEQIESAFAKSEGNRHIPDKK